MATEFLIKLYIHNHKTDKREYLYSRGSDEGYDNLEEAISDHRIAMVNKVLSNADELIPVETLPAP